MGTMAVQAMNAAMPELEGLTVEVCVVETNNNGNLNVLPIRNPARRSAHHEFRAGTRRHMLEEVTDAVRNEGP